MVANYKTVYVIKIKDSENRNTWYYSRRGQVFETEKIEKGGNVYYQVDYIHKVPSEYAKVLEVKKEAKYFK